MENGGDFINILPDDLSIKIFTSLEDPSDLVRFSAVSRSCRRFVITNGLCKHLCLRMFPQLSRVDHVNELGVTLNGHAEAGSSNFMEREALEREHRVYAFLAQRFLSFAMRECISEAIIASSTDNYPEESIDNTLDPGDEVGGRASYWSSRGQSDAAVPETLTYKLNADLCVITEINIKPFQACFQPDDPIYSAKSVRFRMGHIKSSMENHVDEFVWTYTSQEFPMAQENCLQNFKLPEPILCIGGILQIELLGRVQRQEIDGLFYICVCHVQVVGVPLSPFGIQIIEPSEKFVLEVLSYTQPPSTEETRSVSTLQMRVRRGNVVDVVEDGDGWDIFYGELVEDEDEDEDEEEDVDIE